MSWPVYVGRSPGKGQGVFAARDIAKGEVVEVCPTIVAKRTDLTEQSYLYRYTFGDAGKFILLVLGYGSLYNHDAECNVYHGKADNLHWQEYIALRDIKQDEELTINYWARNKVPPSPERIRKEFETKSAEGDANIAAFIKERESRS